MADKSITKTELVASIASATGQSQSTVSGVLDSLFATVSEAVATGTKVTIPGWLAVERVSTSARTGRNPQTGEEIKIPAGQRVKITAGSKLKAAVK
ncbi:HU family DNA-binding protein [Microbacterium deminutum]|uniref:HU family DNA-binding protein n=1 Tax=Microbacterium deminutum TaxID=344164 RepID=A0ABN2QNX2_9MICO